MLCYITLDRFGNVPTQLNRIEPYAFYVARSLAAVCRSFNILHRQERCGYALVRSLQDGVIPAQGTSMRIVQYRICTKRNDFNLLGALSSRDIRYAGLQRQFPFQ
jgi:hypothetical protein